MRTDDLQAISGSCRIGAKNKPPGKRGSLGSASLIPEVGERCREREMLLREWTECGRRVTKILDGRYAAKKGGAPNLAGFQEPIRLAKAAETEACRSYYRHVNAHDCV